MRLKERRIRNRREEESSRNERGGEPGMNGEMNREWKERELGMREKLTAE